MSDIKLSMQDAVYEKFADYDWDNFNRMNEAISSYCINGTLNAAREFGLNNMSASDITNSLMGELRHVRKLVRDGIVWDFEFDKIAGIGKQYDPYFDNSNFVGDDYFGPIDYEYVDIEDIVLLDETYFYLFDRYPKFYAS